MRLLNRLLLFMILALGMVRAALYLDYAFLMFPQPLESHNLEAKMVLLAYRAQHGLSLYPAWWHYPYVSNFYGPLNSLLVGWMGRLVHGDFRALFLIGRGVSFIAALVTSVVLGFVIARNDGKGAGLAGGLLSVGSTPMFGFTIMVRADALAELLALSGFFLTAAASRTARGVGLVLLLLAILTKQTEVVFLLAAALVPILNGEWRRGLAMLAAVGGALAATVLTVNLLWEPHFASSLLGDRITPWSLSAWLDLLRRMLLAGPELFVLPAIGVYFWLFDPTRTKQLRPAVLALALVAAGLASTGKIGADTNYYMSLRIAAGLAIGTLWQAVFRPAEAAGPPPPGRGRLLALTGMLLTALLCLVPSLLAANVFNFLADRFSPSKQPRELRLAQRSLMDATSLARDPRIRLLTDSGFLDLYQGERAVIGDPYLFRIYVESGRLHPTELLRRVDAQEYDLIITTHDLYWPGYLTQDFRFPTTLIALIETRYKLGRALPGLFVYVPGPKAAAPGR